MCFDISISQTNLGQIIAIIFDHEKMVFLITYIEKKISYL